jgi:hypothetical protein
MKILNYLLHMQLSNILKKNSFIKFKTFKKGVLTQYNKIIKYKIKALNYLILKIIFYIINSLILQFNYKILNQIKNINLI